jgi:hypothetical protein
MAITVFLSPSPAGAQASLIQELRVTITDYESEKVMPGSTFRVGFTVHKPAGIKVTDSLLGVDAWYTVGNQSVDAFTPTSGDSKPFSLSSFEEQDVNQELNVKVLENVPVGQSIYIGVIWSIADVSVSIHENENLVTVVSGENVFSVPIVKISARQNYTRYYIVDGITNDVYVRSDRSNRLYVVGVAGNVEMLPKPFNVLIVVIVGVAIVMVLIVAIVAFKFRGKVTSPAEKQLEMR